MDPNLVILGTIGIDTMRTPFGKAENVLGGSSMYAGYAASFFSRPGVLSVKGEDRDDKELGFLKEGASCSTESKRRERISAGKGSTNMT